MIGFLAGEVAGRSGDDCLIDVSGVGYRVACSATTLASLPAPGERVRLFTHMYVREDVLSLFGFLTEAERTMFEALIAVSGVGPKAALSICSGFTPESFRRALVTDDLDAICAVPGIGKKTAARIVLDLKERLDLPDLSVVGSDGRKDVLAQARSALENLGYSPGEVRAALGEIDRDHDTVADGSVEAVVRSALRVLAS